MSQDQLNRLARIFTFEKKLREAKSLVEIRYTVTNELRNITPFVFAFFGEWANPNKFKIDAISDIAVVEQTSSTTILAQKIIREKLKEGSPDTHLFTIDKDSLIPAKGENPIPDKLLWVPCFSNQKGPQAALILARDENWEEQDIEYIRHLSASIGHAMGSLKENNFFESSIKVFKNTWFQFLIIAGLIASMFIPISLSTVGKSEIVPKDPYVINAPIEGVIQEVFIQNNDNVDIGTTLISFEKTDLQNDYDLAFQELKVIETELLQAKQSSFQSKEDKAMVSQLQSKIKLVEQTLSYQKYLLDESTINSPSDGIAVIKDKSLLIGKPFKVGETIMVIADPSNVVVEIMMPVKDAITVKKDAEINVFLDSDPLNVIPAKVSKFSYEPELTSENTLAYRVTAEILTAKNSPRIGLRGTAKIFGEEVKLFFYLFRKPIIFVRQTLGI